MTPLMHEKTRRTVIVIEEDPHLLPMLVALLQSDDLHIMGTGDPVEAVTHCRAAGPETLVLLSSALAGYSPSLIGDLLSGDRPPKMLLTCCRPPTCPLNPAIDCFRIGCLEKPFDFNRRALRERVRQAFEMRSASAPAPTV